MTMTAIKFIMNVEFGNERKMMSFLPGLLASEIYHEIEQKFRKEGHDHVLFLPRLKKYLNPDQKLADYEPAEEEVLIFRSRFVHYKVKMLDDSVRTFTLDDTQMVNDHIRAIGRKLRIRHYREFVLTKENSEEWLDAKSTLPELNVTPEDIIVFKKVYYVYDNNVTKSDGAELHILYEQTMQSFIGGGLPVVKTDAILLAAYALQERNSDFDHATKFELKDVLPKDHIPKKGKIREELTEQLSKEWNKLKGLQPPDCKFKFIQYCRSLPTYGVTVFNVERIKPDAKKRTKPDPMKMAITNKKILFLNPETNEVIASFLIKQLKRWGVTSAGLLLEFPLQDEKGEYRQFFAEQRETISKMLDGYIKLSLRTNSGSTMLRATPVDKIAARLLTEVMEGDSSGLVNEVKSERQLADPFARVQKLVTEIGNAPDSSKSLAKYVLLLKATLAAASAVMKKLEKDGQAFDNSESFAASQSYAASESFAASESGHALSASPSVVEEE